MPPPTDTPRPRSGFACPCPKCGALEGLRVRAHDLALECGECSEDVDPADVQRLIDDAAALLRWLKLAETV